MSSVKCDCCKKYAIHFYELNERQLIARCGIHDFGSQQRDKQAMYSLHNMEEREFLDKRVMSS